jgi:hypothetical protein
MRAAREEEGTMQAPSSVHVVIEQAAVEHAAIEDVAIEDAAQRS